MKLDIYDLLLEQSKTDRWKYEPVNFTIGRLRMAIKQDLPEKRQLELLEKINNDIFKLSLKLPFEEVYGGI